MYCSKCGSQSVNGERFCKNCGTLLENNQPQQSVNNMNGQAQQQINNGMMGQPMYNQQPMNNGNPATQQFQQSMNQQYSNNNSGLDPKYVEQAVNPNMKKWAILSIVVPIAGIIWYWFIGLNLYLAIFIAATGFGFAEKGKMANKKLATIGKVCSGVLVGMAIIMFVLQIMGIFAQ